MDTDKLAKVINGLEHCSDRTNKRCNPTCPYHERDFCNSELAQDALELLKEQQQTIETQRDIIRTQEEQISDLQDENMSHGYSGCDGNIIL